MQGIYRITNIENNKSYIGSSLNIYKRFKQHKKQLSEGKHHSVKLQRAYDLYGYSKFDFKIIESCPVEILTVREQYYIDLFDGYKNGYNSVPMADNNTGMKHTEETKEKLRKASTGNKNRLNAIFTDEVKKRISEKLKGRKLSDETKRKMSESRKGVKLSDEIKKKISESSTGKVISIETKNKLSLSHIGIKQSPETIEKRVEKNVGKKRTDEIKKKMSNNMLGIKKGHMSYDNKLKRSKKILLINENGTIKEYDGIKICADDLKITSNRISEVLNGKKKFYKGFKFKYI